MKYVVLWSIFGSPHWNGQFISLDTYCTSALQTLYSSETLLRPLIAFQCFVERPSFIKISWQCLSSLHDLLVGLTLLILQWDVGALKRADQGFSDSLTLSTAWREGARAGILGSSGELQSSMDRMGRICFPWRQSSFRIRCKRGRKHLNCIESG